MNKISTRIKSILLISTFIVYTQCPIYALDTLSYLSKIESIDSADAEIFKSFMVSRAMNGNTYTDDEKETMKKLWPKFWFGYCEKKIFDHDQNNSVIRAMFYYASMEDEFTIPMKCLQESYKNHNLELTPDLRYYFITRLSILYLKIGYIGMSRRLLIDNLGDVLELDDPSTTLRFYQLMCMEYYIFYKTNPEFKSEFKRLNDECFELAALLKSGYDMCEHYLLKAYFDDPSKVDEYFEKSLNFLDKNTEQYALIYGIQESNYFDLLYDTEQYEKHYQKITKSRSPEEIAGNTIWNTRFAKYFYVAGQKEKGMKYLKRAIELFDKEKDAEEKRMALLDLPEICQEYGLMSDAYRFEKQKNDMNISRVGSGEFGEKEIQRFDVELRNKELKITKKRNLTTLFILIFTSSIIGLIIITSLYRKIRAKKALLLDTHEELDIVHHDLEQATKEIEEFAAIAIQDIKKPMKKIKRSFELISDTVPEAKNMENSLYFQYILSSLSNLNNILNGIISYAKINESAIAMKPINIDKYIGDCVLMLNTDIEESQAKVELQGLHPIIPGYPELIHQLFLNLISNSIKYRNPDKPPRLEIRSFISDDLLKITFKDNGIGIPEKNLKTIFDLFSRADNSGEVQGTGIGLSFVKKIISLHNGDISVANNVEDGVTFTMSFPLKDVEFVKPRSILIHENDALSQVG